MRPSARRVAVPVTLVVAVAAAAGVGYAVVAPRTVTHSQLPSADSPPPPPPAQLLVSGADADERVPWNEPLRFVVNHGQITTVAVQDRMGRAMAGATSPDGTEWASRATLVPTATYTAAIGYVDAAGKTFHRDLRLTATDTDKHLEAVLSPGDGDVVGVGMPVVVYLSQWVPQDRRALVQRRLSVTTSPAVEGSWHWMNGQEVHWRPQAYWTPGTRVSVHSDLSWLPIGDGVWGRGEHSVSFTIGASHISKVDVAKHVMVVYADGKPVKKFPISAGRDKYPTVGGVHIALEKSQMVIMDSATVGIPRNSPDGYYEKVYWDVRISNGGAFVHAAPWSVAQQGRSNVSHGCVNLSPADAQWFYDFSRRGDIVDILNSGVPPNLSDPGMSDWNMSWAKWLAGSAA